MIHNGGEVTWASIFRYKSGLRTRQRACAILEPAAPSPSPASALCPQLTPGSAVGCPSLHWESRSDSRLIATRVATETSCAHSTQVEAGAGAAETPTCSRGEGAATEATCPPPALSCAHRHGTHPPALPPVWLRTYNRFTAFVSEINPVLQGPQRSVLFPESSLQEVCPARKPRGAHVAPLAGQGSGFTELSKSLPSPSLGRTLLLFKAQTILDLFQKTPKPQESHIPHPKQFS